MRPPGWEIPKTPVTDSGKLWEREDFSGYALFYPFPKHPLQAIAGDRIQGWMALADPLQLCSLE